MKQSESIVNISKALLEAQKEITDPKQTAKNPFFNSSYTPLIEIFKTIRPVYNKHGITILQDVQGIKVSTIFLHESGEWIQQEWLELPLEKQTAQSGGISITYARRYSISAWLGIASEEDNDGNQDDGVDSIKREFDGEELQILVEGQEVPSDFWNIPKGQRYNYIQDGCALKKVDNKWMIVKKSGGDE